MSGESGLPPSLYPPGYRDPEWDGSEAQFRDVVLPARVEAMERTLNEHLQELVPGTEMRWEWR